MRTTILAGFAVIVGIGASIGAVAALLAYTVHASRDLGTRPSAGEAATDLGVEP